MAPKKNSKKVKSVVNTARTSSARANNRRHAANMTQDTNRAGAERRFSPVAAYVRRLYDRGAPLLLAEALLFGVVAIYMFFRPMTILTFMTYVIGAGLVLFGLWRAISGFVASRSVGGGAMDVLFGLVNIVLGVLFCIYPTGSLISLAYIFVILFFFKALRALVFAINMARARFGHYVFNLIMAILLILLACVLFFFPMATAVAVVYYLAIALLLYASADLYMFVELHRLKKAVGE